MNWKKLFNLILVFYVSHIITNFIFQKFSLGELFIFSLTFTIIHIGHYYFNEWGLRKIKKLESALLNKRDPVDWNKIIDDEVKKGLK